MSAAGLPSVSEFDLVLLAPGVRLHVARAGKWKTTLVVARIAASLADDPTRTALVPAVLARGTERLPTARDIARRLEELYDADLDPEVVRVGDVQAVELRLEVADPRFVGGVDTLSEGLALLGDLLFRPAPFTREVVASEKKNLRAAILGLRDDRTEYAVERATRILGRGTPSERYELGAVEEIGAVRPADLRARWRTLVERHPIDLLAVGDHATAAVERAARAALPLERRAAETVAPEVLVPPPPGREVACETERRKGAQAHLCLGFRTGARYLGEGYPATLVLNAVLGADAQSRLFLEVRERAGLAYEAGTILDRLKGTIIAHVGTDDAKLEEAEALALREVERLREDLVPEQELRDARRFVLERVREVEDDPQLAAAFEYARTLTGRRDVTLAQLLDAIEAVRAEDVREAARRLVLDCAYTLRT